MASTILSLFSANLIKAQQLDSQFMVANGMLLQCSFNLSSRTRIMFIVCVCVAWIACIPIGWRFNERKMYRFNHWLNNTKNQLEKWVENYQKREIGCFGSAIKPLDSRMFAESHIQFFRSVPASYTLTEYTRWWWKKGPSMKITHKQRDLKHMKQSI